MIENSWRRLALVLVLAGLGAAFLAAKGLKLGLDLRGGTRLVYRVDIEDAKAKGRISPDSDPKQVMAEMITIIGRRIDPQGVKDPSITQAGSDRILIELPGGDASEAQQIQARIEDLGALEMRMVAYPEYDKLPGGKSFDIEEEKKRLDAWLAKADHKELVARDPLAAIQRFNGLPADAGGPQAGKWLRWAPMFRRQAGETADGKPKWSYERHQLAHPPSDGTTPSFLPINMHEPRHFTGEDLDAKAIMATTDPRNAEPAIAYEITAAKADDYYSLSGDNIGRCKAILLNGYVRLAPSFRDAIYGRGQVSGGFTAKEVADLVIVLKTGSLKIVPLLESNTTIGPTLGHIAIEKGSLSIITGSILIVLFMLAYYRVTGMIAVLALLMNVALIFGSLAFISATLTLPGLAGIVLTIGMAVDANILIFERIREEKDRGKDLLRAVEAGFEKAMSTILDANITTFLTGLILYNVGIGPIRGFAVTLMLGIVSSVFSAVFVGRLLFHYLLAKTSTRELNMARLFARPRFRFLRRRKPMAAMSTVLVAAGLAAFLAVPTNTKYGLDFTGGAAFQVALQEPMTQQELFDALTGDKEFMADFEKSSPQIVTLSTKPLGKEGNVAARSGASHAFLIKLKLTPEKRREFEKRQQEARARNETYVPPYIRIAERILARKLADDPFTFLEPFSNDEEGYTVVGAVLHSTEKLSVETVKKAVERRWEVNEVVACEGTHENKLPGVAEAKDIYLDFKVMRTFKPEDKDRFLLNVQNDLRDDLGNINLGTDRNPKRIVLSSPFPESSLIGSRAVGDLRDAAIGSILLSLLIIVMYIRVRFHEYKYGIGACVALVHDVTITLGILTALHWAGVIHAEIDLSMIAAFLTIIGYSLNDTIVVFDRIRENLEIRKKLGGKQDFEQLIDESVNQTLSRTVLTSATTFIVVATLFVFNYGAGSVLEGFAFSMMVGIIVGTYSSIWIANPIVYWLTERQKTQAKPGGEQVAKSGRAAKIAGQPEPV